MKRFTLKHGLSLLTVACLVALAPAFAQDRAKTEVKPTNKGNFDRNKEQAQPEKGQAHPQQAAIPECLQKLNLSAQQQGQIKDIVRSYDESLQSVWKQFSDRYMATIKMESLLLAAIEDNLTEAQRQQVRDQRRKTAKHEKAIAATSTQVNQAVVTQNEETTKPTNAAEEGLAAVSVSLTDEQESAAEVVQEKYRSQMRSLNRDIQGLHTRLVSLEADKLVEIEKVLTKEQLVQLRTHRKNAPDAPKVASKESEPKNAE